MIIINSFVENTELGYVNYDAIWKLALFLKVYTNHFEKRFIHSIYLKQIEKKV